MTFGSAGTPAAAALCIALAACLPAAGPADSHLRVLTYNIHAGRDAEQAPNLDRVAAVILDAAADVVLLQEVDRRTLRSGGEDHYDTLMRLTGMHGGFASSLDYQGGEYGVAVLSRHPIDSAQTVRLHVQPPQERAGGSFEPRVGIHVVLRTPRGPVHVVNTHLDPAGEATFRHQEVIALLAHASGSVPPDAALIVGGDLNARPDTPEVAALRLSFTDAWERCGDGGPGFSYPAHRPDRRIDYILFRGLRCTSSRVIDSGASDHRPVLAILQP
ncbi:MAG TPA: endonuclease/exonuclease/phosphatase family protein [Longimicrobiales bacterium]|nr:endonuclease/exonuclease/phosphatase family protein [Longimicrobiales bacterium]